MNKDEIERTALAWLNKNQPENKKLIISCGSAGALIAVKSDEWKVIWADNIIIYSDIVNKHQITRICPGSETRLEQEPVNELLTCHCGRSFTKRFALTNHKKVCKQVEQPLQDIRGDAVEQPGDAVEQPQEEQPQEPIQEEQPQDNVLEE